MIPGEGIPWCTVFKPCRCYQTAVHFCLNVLRSIWVSLLKFRNLKEIKIKKITCKENKTSKWNIVRYVHKYGESWFIFQKFLLSNISEKALISEVYPFRAKLLFLYSLKTSENKRFSDIFRRVYEETSGMKWVNRNYHI